MPRVEPMVPCALCGDALSVHAQPGDRCLTMSTQFRLDVGREVHRYLRTIQELQPAIPHDALVAWVVKNLRCHYGVPDHLWHAFYSPRYHGVACVVVMPEEGVTPLIGRTLGLPSSALYAPDLMLYDLERLQYPVPSAHTTIPTYL